jgi:D-alanyl-lipoteichoic acid acyltransferase DltB (MBOAT superfamily)
MAFTSFAYLLFFPAAAALYFLFPPKFRWASLVISGALFYSYYSPLYLLLLVSLGAVTYVTGLMAWKDHGRIWAWAGILINLLLLALFKILPLLTDGNPFSSWLPWFPGPSGTDSIVLPLGLSFYVFTCLSYLLDIRKKFIVPQKHAGILAAYLLFFPKLAQGPIERAGNSMAQFGSPRFDAALCTMGFQRILWGLFKKLFIADRLAPFVSAVFADPGDQQGLSLVLAAVLFTFQIYADFSAYTDIAVGSAAVLGIRLSENFRQPYLSASVKEFWNRWHISFSYWLRDYLYLPLAYSLSRKMKAETYLGVKTENWIYLLATFCTFAVCGIWHGMGWNYLLWGLLFAFYLSFGRFSMKFRKNLRKKLGFSLKKDGFTNILATFLLVSLAWVFFRAATVGDALRFLGGMFRNWDPGSLKLSFDFMDAHGLPSDQAILCLLGILILVLTDRLDARKGLFQTLDHRNTWLRWSIYYLLAALTLGWGMFGSQQFIYMQF